MKSYLIVQKHSYLGSMSQNLDLDISFYFFMSKKGKLFSFFFRNHFSRFHELKTRT